MTSKQADKGKQGFASMDPEKQHEIASKGGRTSHKGEEPTSKADKADAKGHEAVDAADQDESDELDELMDLLEGNDLSEIDPEEAVETIDEWHDLLMDSGDAGLKEIGKSLTKLKRALSASKPKPEAIAEALTQIGEQTDEYANDAGRGYKTKLHKLGKALSKAGKSLEKEEA